MKGKSDSCLLYNMRFYVNLTDPGPGWFSRPLSPVEYAIRIRDRPSFEPEE